MTGKVHLIGNAHLDPVWLWQWHEGYAEVKATFRSALDRMKEFPDYKFTSACAAYYEWIKESDPGMFEEIRERVREGRWCIAGGWYIQPDCNIPCGESFARHSLISQRFFKNEFGKTAKTGYNVDSFGHNGSIPMILRNSGMDGYVFMRPGEHEKALGYSLFNWESRDGSVVPTFRIPERYNIDLGGFDLFDRIANMASDHAMMAFYGIGNHGGGPTIALLDKMGKELDDRFVYSTPDEYFDEVRGDEMPLLKDDLQFHAKGCYSACSFIKKNNRRSENMLLAAESLSVLSNNLLGTEYPSAQLERGWKNTAFNQFHDIMGGCSIKDAYDSAAMQHGETQSICDRVTNFAVQQISWNIDTLGDSTSKPDKPGWGAGWSAEGIGTPVVIFNPLPWKVDTFISIHDHPVRVTDRCGNEVPCQTIRAPRTNGNNKWETGWNVTLPALGYTMYRVFYRGERSESENPFTVTDTTVENSLVKLTFDASNGELAGYYDKKNGRELLASPTRTVLIDETEYDTWAHGIREFKKETDTFAAGSVKVIETGPCRTVVRTVTYGSQTVITRDWILRADSPVVTVKTVADFREKHRMLKFRFPVNAASPKAICEIPFGSIERPVDGTESVCQKWFALTENGKDGLAVLNDSKYSFDADGSVVSLTILRGAVYADHYGQKTRDELCEYMDQGRNEFTFALMPFVTESDTVKRASELNSAPRAIIETFRKGTLPTEYSGISVDADNIIVTAVKKHEDSDAVVIRAYECEDRDTDAVITLFGHEIKAHFGHSAVKTLIITSDSAEETNFLEY